MNHTAMRIMQAAVAAALLEVVADTVRSYSFYLVPTAMFAVIEIVYFLVVVCVAALIVSRITQSASWLQRIVFFVIVLAPSLVLWALFFRGVTYYEQGGTNLVANYQITTAGYKELALSGIISAAIALIATIIYFRRSAVSKLPQVDG